MERSASIGSWWLPRAWAAFLLSLVAVTWRLWVPDPSYPPVPMLELSAAAQQGLSWGSLGGIVLGCVIVLLAPGHSRWSWTIVSASLAVAFVSDQHRLQPWAYQAAVYGLIFAWLERTAARRWLIVLAASIYIYSALGKFDFQFAHTVGQDFLRPVWTATGLDHRLNPSQRAFAALVLPAVELAGGVGVLVRPTRRVAGCLILAMHGGLLLLLSPLGLHHSYGVLLWNLLLAVGAWELFLRRPTSPAAPAADAGWSSFRIGPALARGVALVALVAPLSERSGYWDHWPSWALYSPHNSRVKLQVHRTATDLLPVSLGGEQTGSQQRAAWVGVDLDAWSLKERGVPIYPQARYQLALATKLAVQHELEDAVRCIEQGVADRWTGRREERVAIGAAEMRRLLSRYWLVGVGGSRQR